MVENPDNLPGFISDDALDQIEAMAGLGMPLHHMAAILHVSEDSFRIWAACDPDVQEAIKLGRARASGKVRQTAYDMAISGKWPEMTKFWLKARDGWNDSAPQQKLAARLGEAKGKSPYDNMTDEELIAAAATKLGELGVVRVDAADAEKVEL